MQNTNTEAMRSMLQAYLEKAKEERRPEVELAVMKKEDQLILVRL